MAYLAVLRSDTGVPLFSRTKGELSQLPFPLIGTLNGVHSFASQHATTLASALSEDAKIVWKSYHDKVTLILVAGEEGSTDIHFKNMLDYMYNGLVSIIGLDTLVEVRSTERLKRETRLSFGLIDTLLFGTDLLGPLTHSVDVIATTETPILESLLNAFSEAAETQFACAFVRGRVVAATAGWWDLSPFDSVMLSLLCTHHPKSTSQDLPVYLPKASPNTPHRLLSLKVVEDFTVALLCEAVPTLEDVQEQILPSIWTGHLDTVHKCIQTFPRNVPAQVSLENSLLAFILVNDETHRCLSSYDLGPAQPPDAPTNDFLSPGQRRLVLTSFYKSTVGSMFPHALQDDNGADTDLRNIIPHQPVETYLCAEEYKCYALHFNFHQLFTLFTPSTPTYSMRSLSYSTLDSLTTDQFISV
ncbi:protein fuzzy homolog isoform X2 [Sycon ciliatum]|uniref:protein fuzzy homolog isoform X2 n=1 Tax=Sycon ciliatum TaxID=27933 RepID=UPI0031F6FE9C